MHIYIFFFVKGELIDRIEYHIGNGCAHTQVANRKLSKAEKFMSKARKVCIYFFVGQRKLPRKRVYIIYNCFFFGFRKNVGL